MALKWFRKNKHKSDKHNKQKADELPQAEELDELEGQYPESDSLQAADEDSEELTDEQIEKLLEDEIEAADQDDFQTENKDDLEAGPAVDPVEALEPVPAADEAASPEPPSKAEKKGGYFKRLRSRLFKSRDSFSGGFDRIFTGKTKFDDEILEELEEHLITSDIGVQTSIELIEKIAKAKVKDADQLKSILKDEIEAILTPDTGAPETDPARPHVVLVVGVNGVGKTTTIGKLAASANAAGKRS